MPNESVLSNLEFGTWYLALKPVMSKKSPVTNVFLELHVPDFDLAKEFYGIL